MLRFVLFSALLGFTHACTCQWDEPKTSFCKADFVGILNLIFKQHDGGNDFIYQANVLRMFKVNLMCFPDNVTSLADPDFPNTTVALRTFDQGTTVDCQIFQTASITSLLHHACFCLGLKRHNYNTDYSIFYCGQVQAKPWNLVSSSIKSALEATNLVISRMLLAATMPSWSTLVLLSYLYISAIKFVFDKSIFRENR
ncbi:hypothetical protein L596_027759 [Steinernema carpocapsae]|uniref:Minor glycoprotein n=1 Tax=Steinernema carpocapsae TaxID=34508 RepID=A0A4U5LWG4_STECR|nr:hypothetical protein L596_027759 [Steinernema carpocapsae]